MGPLFKSVTGNLVEYSSAVRIEIFNGVTCLNTNNNNNNNNKNSHLLLLLCEICNYLIIENI